MMSLEWNPLPKTLSPEKRYRKPFSYSWPWGIFSLCEGHHIFPLSCRTFLFFSVRVAYDRSDCVTASKVLSSASAPPPSSPSYYLPCLPKGSAECRGGDPLSLSLSSPRQSGSVIREKTDAAIQNTFLLPYFTQQGGSKGPKLYRLGEPLYSRHFV